jgi:folate-dependent tRNA-U54 methylase TrmFO/GidA
MDIQNFTTMIKKTPNNRDRTYTLRRYHKGLQIAKYRTLPLSKEEFKQFEYFGSDSLIKYIKDNNLKNIKK